jgi:hypothetical protein
VLGLPPEHPTIVPWSLGSCFLEAVLHHITKLEPFDACPWLHPLSASELGKLIKVQNPKLIQAKKKSKRNYKNDEKRKGKERGRDPFPSVFLMED